MIEAANVALGLATDMWWQWFTVFLRIAGVVSLLPAFGERTVPIRIKLGASAAFAIILTPATPEVSVVFVDWLSSLPLLLSEVFVGVLLGLGIRLLVITLQVAGAIAAQATSLSQLLGNATAEPMPALGQVLLVAGLALAVTAGLHVRAAAFLLESYELFPPGVMPLPNLVAQWGIAQISGAFSSAFQLAAPFVIASVLYNLTLGVINRAMPQLMVAFVGAPVITAGGLILLLLASPLILSLWLEALHHYMADPITGVH